MIGQTKPSEFLLKSVAMIALVAGGLEVMIGVARIVKVGFAFGSFSFFFGLMTIGLGIGVDQHRKRQAASKTLP